MVENGCSRSQLVRTNNCFNISSVIVVIVAGGRDFKNKATLTTKCKKNS